MKKWGNAVPSKSIPLKTGKCFLIKGYEVAVFHYSDEKWFAVQNKCPHCGQEVLSRGMVGDSAGEPKVVCPLHKQSFSLMTGYDLADDKFKISIFPTKKVDDQVFIQF